MKRYVAERILKHRALLGEGAVWDEREQALWWVDILAGQVHRFNPVIGIDICFEIGTPVGAIVPGEENKLYLAVKDGFALYDTETKQLTMLAQVPHAHPVIRFNDGKCDSAGRFWAGTLAEGDEKRVGKLYVLEHDRTVRVVLEDVGISNGIAWSHNGASMYYIDSMSRTVVSFAYDSAAGNISNPRIIRTFSDSEGVPDGMTIDSEGALWVALWDGGKVVRVDPVSGTILAEVVIPGVSRITSCAFGGQDLRTLYITTASIGLKTEEQDAGSLFAASLDVAGVPAYRISIE